jgi:hypothetical protein
MYGARGVEPLDLDYDELAEFLRDDVRSAERLIKEAGSTAIHYRSESPQVKEEQ